MSASVRDRPGTLGATAANATDLSVSSSMVAQPVTGKPLETLGSSPVRATLRAASLRPARVLRSATRRLRGRGSARAGP